MQWTAEQGFTCAAAAVGLTSCCCHLLLAATIFPHCLPTCNHHHQVVAGAHFEKDLGLDSLDVVELVMAFEEEFQVCVCVCTTCRIHSLHGCLLLTENNIPFSGLGLPGGACPDKDLLLQLPYPALCRGLPSNNGSYVLSLLQPLASVFLCFQVEIPDADADKIFSVEDAVNYIASHPMAK